MNKYLLILVILLSGCSTLPKVVEPITNQGHEVENIHIVSHGWHTGIIIPSEALAVKNPELRARFKGVDFLEFGWGDAGFYQANEITSKLTLRAMFLPTSSVVHVVGFTGTPADYFKGSIVKRARVKKQNMQTLLQFISNSFQRDEKGKLIELRKGIYGNSQFYSGVGDYYLFNTCNKWTAKALYSAGLNITPTFKLSSSSIMNTFKEEDP